MLSFLRAADFSRRATAHQKRITYEDGAATVEFFGPSEGYSSLHHIPNTTSFINPPPHLHFYQDETFQIEGGAGVWWLPTNPDPAKRETVLRAGDTINLPPAIYHQFRNISDTEPLVLRVRIDPRMKGIVSEEQFFRNLFGYLEDCRRAKKDPSPFQMQLLLWTIQTGYAIPVPGSDSVKWWASKIAVFVMGVIIGEWLLGYKRSYPEYYKGQDTQ